MTHLDDTSLASLADSGSTHPHLESCQTCPARHAPLSALARTFQSSPSPAADPATVHVVMNRINRRRPARTPWLLATAAAAALALFAVLALRDADPSPASTFASRGGPSTAPRVTTFVHAPPDAPRTPATPNLTVGRELALSFRVLAPPTNQPTYLLIAACDKTATLHWAVPVWDDPTTDPHGLLLDPNVPVLDPPTQLHPDAPPGALTILAITSETPITVQTVERHVATVGCDGPSLATRLRADVATTPLNLR